MFGGNYEYAFDENNTLGASYLNFQADSLPERDGLSVYNLRAYVAGGGHLVTRVEGSFTNVVGLPLEATARLLRRFGLTPADP